MVKFWLPAVTVAGMILAGPAFGHAKLQSTIPPADARLQEAPKSLTLSFNEDVRLAVLALTADGKDIPVTVDRSAPPARRVSVMLPVLAVGKYQVQWSALSADDGHVSKGTFTFAIVSPPAALAPPAGPAPPAATSR